jgi:zinc D-Ala-D-Ala carboxypeptidase
VSNAGSPKPKETNRLSKYSASYHDDIAQAQRDVREEPRSPKRPKWLGWAVLAIISALAPILFFSLRPAPVVPPAASPVAVSPTARVSPSPNLTDSQILGHKPYEEAPQTELESIGDGLQMRKAAAAKFLAMVDAAQSEGVSLVPISAFRSVADQTQLFFDVSAERGQSATKRSDVSAPPGYSEHHTGYAVDIGDGNQPDTNLSESFDQTEAFRWLSQNAPRYNFEMSFQKNNPDKISYEPWHWRFVGDRKSLETFYKGKKK